MLESPFQFESCVHYRPSFFSIFLIHVVSAEHSVVIVQQSVGKSKRGAERVHTDDNFVCCGLKNYDTQNKHIHLP